MPRLLSSATIIEKNQLQSDHPFAMLFRLVIPGAPAPILLAGYDQDVLFAGETYQRFPLDVDLLEEPSSMDLVHVRVTLANVDQGFVSLLENYWAPVASPQWLVTIWQIDASVPDATAYETGEVFAVASVSTDFVTAVVDLVAEGLSLGTTLPKRRYVATQGFSDIPRRT